MKQMDFVSISLANRMTTIERPISEYNTEVLIYSLVLGQQVTWRGANTD